MEAADVNIREMQYLYNDGQNWHFMDTETYDQLAISEGTIEEIKKQTRSVGKSEYACNNIYIILEDALKRVILAYK